MALPFPTPLDEHAAVNQMLLAIGESPINTLEEGPTVSEAATALSMLRSVSRTVQQSGWNFNTVGEYQLVPDNAGRIQLPDTILNIILLPAYYDVGRVIKRGNRLYNLSTGSDIFAYPMTAAVVQLLTFEELPDTARDYITVRALRQFVNRVMGDEFTHQINQADEALAFVALRQQDGRLCDTGLFDVLNPRG